MEKVLTDEQEMPQTQLSTEQIVSQTIQRINDKEFCFHFYCPALNTPSGGIGVLLKMAHLMKKNGYNVKVWYEAPIHRQASTDASNKARARVDIFERFAPNWVDFPLTGIEFAVLAETNGVELAMSDGTKEKAQMLHVSVEDFLIIPEGFPNVMQKTAGVNCKRIVLAQSWAYILLGMQNGQTWQHYGINDVISVSDFITDYINGIMPGMNIKKLRQGISRKTFSPPAKTSDKYPMIAYQRGRGQESDMKVMNVIKMFYALNPHLRWVRFIELANMTKEVFAERLKTCAFVLYADEIAGFGTLPLEAMACGTHVVGYAAQGGKEYQKENNGFWCTNGDPFQLAELLGIAVDKWVAGEMDIPDIQQDYDQLLADYTDEGEEQRILEIISEYTTERKNELEQIVKK